MCFFSVVVSVSFDKSSYSVNESDGKVHPVLSLDGSSAIDITVYVFSTSGSAGIGADYEFEKCDVTFQSGNNNMPLDITIIDDGLLEPDENFILTINSSSLPSHVDISDPGIATVTILNDGGK